MDWVKSRNSRFCLQKWASFGPKSAVVRPTFGKENKNQNKLRDSFRRIF